MNLKLLEEIGLTEGEVKVYLALLKLGSSRTGELAVTAGVSSSKIYTILDRLEKKGLVGHVIKAGVKKFTSMEPKRILDYLNEKEAQLSYKRELVQKMLPELEMQHGVAEKSEATVYDGFKAVINFFRNILDELKADEVYYVIGAGYGENISGLREFFLMHHHKRHNKKIKVKMLANYDVKDRLVESTKLNSEVRFLPQYLITNMEVVFYKNKVFIVFWTHDPKGFLLEDAEAVKSFQKYFDAFWKIATK